MDGLVPIHQQKQSRGVFPEPPYAIQPKVGDEPTQWQTLMKNTKR